MSEIHDDDYMDREDLFDLLKSKMSELMELYDGCSMHVFAISAEVKELGMILVQECQEDEAIRPIRPSEQILLVAEALHEVQTAHKQKHNYR